MKFSSRSAALPAAFLFASCLMLRAAPAAADTLYEDLGGEAGVTAVVDRFLWNLADDERVAHFFVESNLERLRTKLIEYICVASEGPCTYTGDDMRRTHANMNVGEADFNVGVESLILAMEAEGIPTGVQNRLLKVLAPVHPDVVQD